jgi:hypothetical protein
MVVASKGLKVRTLILELGPIFKGIVEGVDCVGSHMPNPILQY